MKEERLIGYPPFIPIWFINRHERKEKEKKLRKEIQQLMEPEHNFVLLDTSASNEASFMPAEIVATLPAEFGANTYRTNLSELQTEPRNILQMGIFKAVGQKYHLQGSGFLSKPTIWIENYALRATPYTFDPEKDEIIPPVPYVRVNLGKLRAYPVGDEEEEWSAEIDGTSKRFVDLLSGDLAKFGCSLSIIPDSMSFNREQINTEMHPNTASQ